MAAVKPDLWMPLYFGDYIADTMHLTTIEHGAYLLILMHAWMTGGPLPADPERLRVISKMDKAAWRRSWPTLSKFLPVSGDCRRNKRLDSELAKARNILDQRSEAGKASAEKRWGQRHVNGNGNAPINEEGNERITKSLRKNAPSQSQSQEVPSQPQPPPQSQPQGKARASRAQKTPMPPDFQVSERVKRWAKKHGFDRLDEHLNFFKNKCEANGYSYISWDAGFMGAIQGDWAQLRGKQGQPKSGAEDWANEIPPELKAA